MENIPGGIVGKTIDTAMYSKHITKRNILQGSIYNKWKNIWVTELQRAFTTGFEVYGLKAQNPEDAEVDIFAVIR
ncbi:hypothetical protein [Parafilimonas sp.]|uniref:hypothetical protein n=1 Tax=Parafilimonas sp. TaxID=1969739 RepID=UPI0039E35029